jgi:hypothetical protein
MNTVLEVLEAAQTTLNHRPEGETIADGLWRFADWNRCTCGHIYAAARSTDPRVLIGTEHDTGAVDAVYNVVERDNAPDGPQELYVEVLQVIADANGIDDFLALQGQDIGPSYYVHSRVSDATALMAREEFGAAGDEETLTIARRLVAKAITWLNAKYEADRKLLAEGGA